MKRRTATQGDAKRHAAKDATPLAERAWLNLSETAEHFALHRTTVSRLVRKGEIPAGCVTKFGNAIRINRAELERWISQRDQAA